MKTCFVTFDQPLYAKAVKMVSSAVTSSSKLSSIVVRLGGFHLLMSFMGAIGNIMAGSGLKELWYAKDSTPKMLTGHHYARALRAHFLTQIALQKTLLDGINLEKPLIDAILSLHHQLMTTGCDVSRNILLCDLAKKLSSYLDLLASKSRTSKLWVQYYKQVEIIRRFVRAERSADCELHLESVREMIPFFHAAGHLAYAKSAHLYLQQMSVLEKRMPASEYEYFTKKGGFTIRRTHKMWAGIWSDMTIEQVLMRQMKVSGGLTHGRGMTDNATTQWVASLPTCTELINQFEEFCDVAFLSGVQHVELRE